MPIRKSIFNRAVVMRRVHDLVEIDAGDTPIYDEQARATQADRERRAADRIYSTKALPGKKWGCPGAGDRHQPADRPRVATALGLRVKADQKRSTPGLPTSSGHRPTVTLGDGSRMSRICASGRRRAPGMLGRRATTQASRPPVRALCAGHPFRARRTLLHPSAANG